MIESLQKDIERLIRLLEQARNEASVGQPTGKPPRQGPSAILDFNTTKKEHRRNLLERQMGAVVKAAMELSSIAHLPENKRPIQDMQALAQELSAEDIDSSIADSRRMASLCSKITDPSPRTVSIKTPRLPDVVQEDILADSKEIEKCMASGCYRSATILCGRILETALHRKYFEVTGQDILEKNPGIGLGNLIAKLVEKNVSFDPGLTQQIHLINQVRVFSVHKKQEAFYPSKGQAEAMVLYTMDALEKLFARK